MSTIILFAIALFTIVALYLELGAPALLIVPVVGLFFLLAIAPGFVEEMEAELVRDTRAPAPGAHASAAKREPAVCVDGSGGAAVLHLTDR